MKTIDLDEIEYAEHETQFMENEFDMSKLVTIKEEGLSVIFHGQQMPDHLRTMKTNTEYIFRLIPEGFNDGFNIYRVKRN